MTRRQSLALNIVLGVVCIYMFVGQFLDWQEYAEAFAWLWLRVPVSAITLYFALKSWNEAKGENDERKKLVSIGTFVVAWLPTIPPDLIYSLFIR